MATRQDFAPVCMAYLACVAVALAYLIAAQLGGLQWAWPEASWQPVWNALVADVIATAVIFAFSLRYRNSSMYDPYWSVIPPLLMIYWMSCQPESLSSPRTWLVLVLVWAWGIRLTANWSLHWPGLHHEDWRYPMVRERAGALAKPADFLGIHLFPTLQVFLGCLPIWLVLQHPEQPLGWLDALAVLVTGGAILIEMLADIQLHAFIATRQPGQLMDKGLWGWSRHPNYFGEISFWVGLALFGLAVMPVWWGVIGAVAMLLMFVLVSVPFLDQRSLQRRPEYADYMRRVSALLPLPPRKN